MGWLRIAPKYDLRIKNTLFQLSSAKFFFFSLFCKHCINSQDCCHFFSIFEGKEKNHNKQFYHSKKGEIHPTPKLMFLRGEGP